MVQVPDSWLWKYYTYRVQVYDVWTQQMQTFETTDPYSYSLAADGARTQVMQSQQDTLIMLPLSWLRAQHCRFQLELVCSILSAFSPVVHRSIVLHAARTLTQGLIACRCKIS